ncbi:Bacitracin export permease protein BceB [Clostridium ljungdahlii DSM 13528]|uniref:Bacitracin export permease protein BceB n=1 Tax=Clostridium ljungdahlii (strain ATCC 55383 / DSM 13528 / PETC) TaxID=748727 RepID=D8GPX2_CLOLD|nr:ABC transporter permease [Clostridium ljungdahlii]ADK16063.1 putative permease [Clostridium ljungdahlii DSM 13528]OAA87061.1 Bacitracin export permease protein BceB [Clostridium ljungdahlii DSM 13528]
MTLFNLGINNVKHNFKNYVSYFISTVTSVFILMIFYSIYYNHEIQLFSSSKVKVGAIFKAAAFVVIIFSAIFIGYANSFFIKNKKKEVAIYSLLGMKKKEIGTLMFFENIFLGILALIVGVPLGAFTSRFFLKILNVCMKSNKPIQYTFDIRAIVMTIFVFMIIFLLNSIKAYGIIYKFRLIELIHAAKEGEKKPKFSRVLALLSLIMVIGGYIGVLKMNLESGGAQMLYKGLLIMMLVVAGTYILFNNFIIYIFKLFEKNKKAYYKGENLIGVSQIIYRIKGNSNLLATIAVVSAVAITALCFTFSLNLTLNKVAPSGCPFSIMYQSGSQELNKKVEAVINNHKEIKTTYKTDIVMINGSGLTQKYKGPFEKDLKAPFDMFVMSASEYKDIVNNSGFNDGTDIVDRAKNIKINKENQCFFIEVSNSAEARGRLAGDELNATIGRKAYKLDISDSSKKCVLGVKFEKTTIVVPDTFFNKLLNDNRNNTTVIRAYNFDNALKSGSVVTETSQMMPKDKTFSSYYDMYTEVHTLYGSYVFIGAFLGILFVVSTGSIMYYKQLTEAYEDKNRYSVLSKIGLTKKETLRIISKQLGFIFLMPLLFGILHSIFPLVAYMKYLCGFSITQMEWMGMTMGVYVVIYLCFYLLSVKSYMKIITKNTVY